MAVNLHILIWITQTSHCTIFRHIFLFSASLKYSCIHVKYPRTTLNEKVKSTICFRIRIRKIPYSIKFIWMSFEKWDIIHYFSPYLVPLRQYEVFWSCQYLFPVDIEFAETCQYLSFIDNSHMTICFQMLFFLKNRQFLILDLIYCVRINCLGAVYLASVLLGLSYEAFWKNFRELHVLFSCGKQCSHLAKRYKIALDMLLIFYT